MLRRGDLVRTWFDTGACGPSILYGVVVASGPMACVVRWESGARNRLRHGDYCGVDRVSVDEQGDAARALGVA
jgi:hypothetical protein